LKNSTVIAASNELAFCDLDEGKALIDLSTGAYFKLNSTASYFCSLVAKPQVFGNVISEMSTHFDVDPRVLETDLIQLIDTLAAQGLISVKE
jgi:hypothetical protein